MLIYPTATDHINKRPYDAMVSAHAEVVHPLVKYGTFFAPIYEPFDKNLLQKSKIPIAKMVEYNLSRTKFTIISDYDVLEILHQIDAYVAEVYPMKENVDVRSYIKHILSLRKNIYQLFLRVLARHPDWKKEYIGERSIFHVLADVYKKSGLGNSAPEMMFEELSICPTIRANADTSLDENLSKASNPEKRSSIYG